MFYFERDTYTEDFTIARLCGEKAGRTFSTAEAVRQTYRCFALFMLAPIDPSEKTRESFYRVSKIVVHKREKSERS